MDRIAAAAITMIATPNSWKPLSDCVPISTQAPAQLVEDDGVVLLYPSSVVHWLPVLPKMIAPMVSNRTNAMNRPGICMIELSAI